MNNCLDNLSGSYYRTTNGRNAGWPLAKSVNYDEKTMTTIRGGGNNPRLLNAGFLKRRQVVPEGWVATEMKKRNKL